MRALPLALLGTYVTGEHLERGIAEVLDPHLEEVEHELDALLSTNSSGGVDSVLEGIEAIHHEAHHASQHNLHGEVPRTCACNPELHASQHTTCTMQVNRFGLTSMVVHHRAHQRCNPLEGYAECEKLEFGASFVQPQHNCKYFGGAFASKQHASCSDIQSAAPGLSVAGNNYYVDIEGTIMQVFCDMTISPAHTYRRCEKCLPTAEVLGQCSSTVDCCAAMGMQALPFDQLTPSAQAHYGTGPNGTELLSGLSAGGVFHDKEFCTTNASTAQPQDFVDADADGYSECKCCECQDVCEAGNFRVAADRACVLCPAGKFTDGEPMADSGSCTLCPDGKFNFDEAMDMDSELADYNSSLTDAVQSGSVPGAGTASGPGERWTDASGTMTVARHRTSHDLRAFGGVLHHAHDWLGDKTAMRNHLAESTNKHTSCMICPEGQWTAGSAGQTACIACVDCPTMLPTKAPTASPTGSPTKAPTAGPTKAPTASPTAAPTLAPAPTLSPTLAPTGYAPPTVVYEYDADASGITLVGDACESNAANDQIEHVQVIAQAGANITVEVRYLPVHDGFSSAHGVAVQCWHFAGEHGEGQWDAAPVWAGQDAGINATGTWDGVDDGSAVAHRFTFVPERLEEVVHYVRCGIIDLASPTDHFDAGAHCAHSRAGLMTNHHFDNADVMFTAEIQEGGDPILGIPGSTVPENHTHYHETTETNAAVAPHAHADEALAVSDGHLHELQDPPPHSHDDEAAAEGEGIVTVVGGVDGDLGEDSFVLIETTAAPVGAGAATAPPAASPTAAPTELAEVMDPQDCSLSEWGEWSECTNSCGGGFSMRIRDILQPAMFGGTSCPEGIAETEQCHQEECPEAGLPPTEAPTEAPTLLGAVPINCVVEEWSVWSDCSMTCDGGIQLRERAVLTYPSDDGTECPVLVDTAVCNLDACVDEGATTPLPLPEPTAAPTTDHEHTYEDFGETAAPHTHLDEEAAAVDGHGHELADAPQHSHVTDAAVAGIVGAVGGADPTAEPTEAPTKLPTATPTDFPTMAPTKAPTTSPTPACVGGEFRSAASGACAQCAAGRYSSTENASRCTICSNGRYAAVAATECTGCAVGQYHATTGSECTDCEAGKIAAIEGQTSCEHCPSGRFQDANTYHACSACPADSWTNEQAGATVCVAVPTAAPTKAPTTSPTVACDPGKYRFSSICEPCGPGEYSNVVNAASCTACDNGQHATASSTECTDCPVGQYHATTGSECTDCEAGKIAAIEAQTSCEHCPSGRFQDAAVYHVCDACAAGMWTNELAGATQCVAVPTATPTKAPTEAPTKAPTTHPTKAPTASPTKAPTASPTSSPTKAPTASPTSAPTKAPTKVPTASPTSAPSKAPTATPTEACAPGKYRDGSTLACENCAAGSHTSEYNAAACSVCPAGRFASVAASSCEACPVGKYHATTADECTDCAAGTIAAALAQTSCDHCPSGKFQDRVAYTVCDACPYGTWTNSLLGATVCAAIPTTAPTPEPTKAPTASPTKAPTASPTSSPTKAPTASPTAPPTLAPTPAAVEFGIYDHSQIPAGGWSVMTAADFSTHRVRFIAEYNAINGVRVIETFLSGNCCFAVAGGEKLTVSDTTYNYQFPASLSGGISCSPTGGYAKHAVIQFYKEPTLAAGATFGSQAACATSANPGIFLRAVPPSAADVPAAVIEFGMYDLQAVPSGGWQLMGVDDLNTYQAELVEAYNNGGGFQLVEAFTSGNCCFAVEGGNKLFIAGTTYGYQFPTTAPADGSAPVIQCSPAGGYTTGTYTFFGTETLPAATPSGAFMWQFESKAACVTNHNPALFMKLPVLTPLELTFGLYDATEAPPGDGWSLMAAEDFVQHKAQFVEYYNENGGVGVIGQFTADNCCIAVAGGDKLYIAGTTYGYQFPADYVSGVAACNPSGGYTDTKYSFYMSPSLDAAAITFSGKAGCATARNPGIYMKEVVPADKALEFAIYDYSVTPAGGWELMDEEHFTGYRNYFVAHYNLNKGLGVILNFMSGNCCFAMQGGKTLIISGTTYNYQVRGELTRVHSLQPHPTHTGLTPAHRTQCRACCSLC
jgi:hypothetical protein